MGNSYEMIDGIEFVSIPEGPFPMGDDDYRDNPPHIVTLSAYSISKNLVTVAQYFQFVRETNSRESKKPSWGWIDDHPIVNVNWDDAMAYCVWLSERTGRQVTLPTEAQWEKAARGTDGRKYPWGNDWDASRLQCRKNILNIFGGCTSPVGSYPSGASPYGVLDLSGNVWEWCLDWYDADYMESKSPKRHVSIIGNIHRVLRGGSWGCLKRGNFRVPIRLRSN
jgi:formylglycine-generating enzyme